MVAGLKMRALTLELCKVVYLHTARLRTIPEHFPPRSASQAPSPIGYFARLSNCFTRSRNSSRRSMQASCMP